MPRLHTTTDESFANNDVYLLYHETTSETGPRLGNYLGVPNGTQCSSGEYDYLIRWGSRRNAGAHIGEVVNPIRAIRSASEKYSALETLDEAGVNVPRFTRNRSEVGINQDNYITYPALGRADSHTRGTDINLLLQDRDPFLTDNDHFVDYIPTELEYRMHVVNGEVIKVHEKRKQREAENHPYIRNHETGYVFLNPRADPPSNDLALDAADALGMDIAAVDVIRAEEDGTEYVLEVNSAPSLEENNLQRYGDALAEHCGLSRIAGLDNVEFEVEDDE